MLAHKEVPLAEKKELIPKIYKIITLIFIIGNYMLCFGLMTFNYELFELITYYSLGYAVVLIISYFFRLMIGVRQSIRIMNDERKRVNQKLPSLPHLNTYVFVIPSYKEELSVLRRTLSGLASHECSHEYLVVLAMEQNEVDSDKKAEILIREYKNTFKGIEFTRHIPQPG
jgi:cellulose synthase/poly-beta-1,6-N-acetylglucosamine synthase-like glycosyltransferase